MSYSKLVAGVLLSPNCTKPRTGKIDTITIHCYVGQVTGRQGCEYFNNTSAKASANYVIGKDGDIWCCVDEANRAWTTGGTLSVNGETGSMNDQHAVTIEVASDTVEPYKITDKAYEALVRLVADIAKRNNMGKLKWKANKYYVGNPEEQNITVHRWFAAKACPGDYIYSRLYAIAEAANEINYPKEEVKKMDKPSKWAEEACNWAVKEGIFEGDDKGMHWQEPVTREQLALILYRLNNKR